jgi:hypothetical protein
MFGPAVIGEEAFAEQQKQKATGSDVFGDRVVDRAEAEANKHGPELTRKGGEEQSLSVDAVTKMLAANGTLFDTLYEAEVARAEGPRKSALAMFRKHALTAGKPDVVAEIDLLLTPAPKKD